MKKIPDEIDNPIDNVLNQIAEYLCPYFYKTGHTPNMITTYSLIFGLLSVYCIYHHYTMGFVVSYTLSYFFDCMDGHYARKYKMTSYNGDLYDHIKDVVVFLMIVVVVFVTYRKVASVPYLVVLVLAILMCTVHLGCQQRQKSKEVVDTQHAETELLDNCQMLCPNKDMIKVTRWFGMGTMNLIFIILIVLLDQKCAGTCY